MAYCLSIDRPDLGRPLTTLAAGDLSLYEATYTTKVIGLSVTLNRSLTRDGDRYHLSQAGKTFMLKLNEDSHFRLESGQIIGEDFVYQLGGVSKRRREVHFDPDNDIIRSLKKKSGPSTRGRQTCWTGSASKNKCACSYCALTHRPSVFRSRSSTDRALN